MKKCAEHNMAVAVTDHGTLSGIWECAKYAKKYGVKFSPGCEVYVVPDNEKCRGGVWGNKGASSHLVLHAMDQKGWSNLLALNTKANFEGYYCQPRVDYQMLREHSEGLWCSTACLGGVLAKPFRDKQSIHLAVDVFKDIFGERLSLEIQINGHDEQGPYNDALIQLSKDSKIPLIACVDSHYLEKSDSHIQDLVFCLGMRKVLTDPTRHRYPPECFSLETPEEVMSKFTKKYGSVGKLAIQRTIDIADTISAKIETDSKDYKFPTLPVEDVEDYKEYLNWKRDLLSRESQKT